MKLNPIMNAANERHVREVVNLLQAQKLEKLQAVPAAIMALHRLVEVCADKTGQRYHIRSLLYSLYNGHSTSLIEILNLDWELRKDLLAVLRAFGQDDFFYDQIAAAFKSRGLFDWFIEAYKSEVA